MKGRAFVCGESLIIKIRPVNHQSVYTGDTGIADNVNTEVITEF